jgi:ADP-ribose pyrophosphatase YjhB (NUDIX family)
MCTPSLAIDVVMEVYARVEDSSPEGLLFVNRGRPPYGLAVVGGFVGVGETAEAAAKREVWEETNISVASLRLAATYSDPRRDPRRHTASIVYVAKLVTGSFRAKAGDDAGALVQLRLDEARSRSSNAQFAFDHSHIVSDYFAAPQGAEHVCRH